MSPLRLARAYDPPGGGKRYLVERLWPRGVRRDDLVLDGWLKDVAPSTSLRKWFGHDPARWEEFRARYAAELDANPEAWQWLAQEAATTEVTLVYSSRDQAHNNAVALLEYLQEHAQATRR